MRAFYDVLNSQGIATGTVAKTILQMTAPAQGAIVPVQSIAFDGTASADGKILVELVRGTSAGTGTAVTPAARGSNNLASVPAPTGKENFSAEPTGGTVIHRDYAAPYGNYVFPVGEVVLAPSEQLNIRVTSPAGHNATGNFSRVEV